MKTVIFLHFLIGCFVVNAQQKPPFYDLTKDKQWLDSLKMTERYFSKQLMYENFPTTAAYVNTNLLLGDYYDKMFQSKKLPDLKKALVYYENVIHLFHFPEDKIYRPLSAKRANLSRKLSNYYYYGNGVKKDIETSLEYAFAGGKVNDELFKFYSKRFFKTEASILELKTVDDTTFEMKLNPFIYRGYKNLPKVEKSLEEIAEKFLASDNNKKYIMIQISTEPTSRLQAGATKFAEICRDYFVKNKKIPLEHIPIETVIGEWAPNLCYVTFKNNIE